MTGPEIADILTQKLIDLNFIVHRYNSKTTSSIYLKLDYGLACGIRIADHKGKEKYRYRFNVMKDYKGDKAVLKDGLISYFYDFSELDIVIDAVQQEKQKKLNKYGIANYQKYMEEESQTDLYKRFSRVA